MSQRPVARLRLTASVAQKRIRDLAEDTANLIWTDHVLEQMNARGILDIEVLRVLRTGYVEENPIETQRGEWKCKITKHVRGGRDVGVVTIIWQGKQLVLVTAEWEDLK